ncbi:MAG: VIT family protein [Bacteroidales bacterium]|jgi:VIT1/CCC1 family predicted Fe2+/Mn2+ transporter|nr:VIT family protein [Bacteroidales bacterium]
MGKHYINRANWLRAAVLGANDGILSTTSLVIGVAAAQTSRETVVLTALAGLVAGACSMAAGEYVSVSSQTDVENADLKREKNELETDPKGELEELTQIYVTRGLSEDLAQQVSTQLMQKNALETHAREELGINDTTTPHPLQAAAASALSFISGGLLPFLVAVCAPMKSMVLFQYGFAIVFLAVSGAITAHLGGCSWGKSILRICFWGTVAMCIAAVVGYIFGVKTGV